MSKMTHRCQVKVAVLVYKGNLSLRGWAALIQSYLHHLQLHMEEWQKIRGKWVSVSYHDPTAFLSSEFRQCAGEGGRETERERETVFAQSQLASPCVWSWQNKVLLADHAILTNSEYYYNSTFTYLVGFQNPSSACSCDLTLFLQNNMECKFATIQCWQR